MHLCWNSLDSTAGAVNEWQLFSGLQLPTHELTALLAVTAASAVGIACAQQLQLVVTEQAASCPLCCRSS